MAAEDTASVQRVAELKTLIRQVRDLAMNPVLSSAES